MFSLFKKKPQEPTPLYFHMRVEYPRFQDFVDGAVDEHALTAPGCNLSVWLNLNQTEAFVKVLARDKSWGKEFSDLLIKQYDTSTLQEIAPSIKNDKGWACCVDCYENNRMIHGRQTFDPLKPRGGLPPIEEQKGIFNVA